MAAKLVCSNKSCNSDECVARAKSVKALQDFFKFESFRPGQMEAVLPVLHGRDAFVRMATGSGKSMCMYIPVLSSHQTSMGVIISPLIGLMDQQV